jgi:hypothetical protein
MDYLFILYIFLSIAIVWGGAVAFIQSERSIGGFLFVIGAILVLVYYGLRWFSGVSLKATQVSYTSWPPVINLCPDFLTMHKRVVGGRTENVCVDLVGVSKGGIQKMVDPNNVTNDNFVFRLYENLTGITRLRRLCQECKDKRVTWEGVYDGANCVADKVPNPSGGTDSDKKCDE